MNELDHRDAYVSGCLIRLGDFGTFVVYWSSPDSRVEYDFVHMCVYNTNVPTFSGDGQPDYQNPWRFIVSMPRWYANECETVLTIQCLTELMRQYHTMKYEG